MTSAPSPALHVLPPTPTDIKLSDNNSSSYFIPQTPKSTTESRVGLPEVIEDTYSSEDQPPPVSMTKDSLPTHITAPNMPNQSAERENASNPGDYGRDLEVGDIAAEEEGEGSQLQRLGLKCMPPAVLPPSPPLTVVDSRDEPEGSANSKASGSALPTELRATSPPMGEKDIADWRVSMGGDEQDERDHQDQAEDEYDPYDLGYSTGVTPVTPVGPSAHRLRHSTEDGTIEEMSEDMPSMQSARNQEAHDHPLRLDVHPPSPLPWEVINPPDINAGTRADGMDGTLYPLDTRSGFAQPLSSRPLIPRSAYYFGPPPIDAAYGSNPVGHIGVHHPREIIRIERDYSGGELVQFAPTYPLELEGRISPTQFLETINAINEHLIDAHSLRYSLIDNALSFLTLQLSRLVLTPHYEKEMRRLHDTINQLNTSVYHPVGLNILWPRKVAFMFLEIEYY